MGVASADGKPGNKKAIAYARELVVYGDPATGRPLLDRGKLAEVSGVHISTIARHLDGWIAERERLAANAAKPTFGIGLSDENAKKHLLDVVFLRSQLDKITKDIDNLGKFLASCEAFVAKFDSADEERMDRALSAFEALQKGSANEQKLRTQFVMIQNQLAKYSGVDNLTELAMTRAKDDLRLAARVAAREAEAAMGHVVDEVGNTGLGVFRKS